MLLNTNFVQDIVENMLEIDRKNYSLKFKSKI